MKYLAKLLFNRFTGWKVSGKLPDGVKKCVMIAAPHTSNFDFIIARLAFYLLGIHVRYLVKKEVFVFPLGFIMRYTGGIPVNRSERNNLVPYMCDLFNKHEELVIMIPPEGTRSKVKRWKTGFYKTATEAKVPIVFGFIDYKNKIAGIGDFLYPSGNFAQDLTKISAFYQNITPKYPEKFSLPTIPS